MSELPPPPLPSCYRHADRATGRSCTRCGRPACGDCLVAASIGSQCPECRRAARPGVATRARDWNARRSQPVTSALIAINIAVFVWVLIGDTGAAGFRDQVSTRELDLGLNKFLLQQTHEWYRLVTAGFLHFGVLHIAMNMLLLFQLGAMLERALGGLRFGLLYFAALLGGSLGALVITGDGGGLHGGASGAVFGLMAAAAIGLHRRGVNVFQTGIGATLVINLLLTFTIPGISIGGHVGGMVVGALGGLVMLAPRHQAPPPWVTIAFPIAAAVACVAASIAVVG
jgi:membrane associated rhomboid family serine protease